MFPRKKFTDTLRANQISYMFFKLHNQGLHLQMNVFNLIKLKDYRFSLLKLQDLAH